MDEKGRTVALLFVGFVVGFCLGMLLMIIAFTSVGL